MDAKRQLPQGQTSGLPIETGYPHEIPVETTDRRRDSKAKPSSDRRGQGKSTSRSAAWKTRKDIRPPPTKVSGRRESKRDLPPMATSDGVVKATKEVLIDEPLWGEGPYSGTVPIQRVYCQNMEHSTFPLLLERVYSDLEAEEPRLRHEMPFCAFQHVFSGVLNATLIDHVRTVNAEDRYAGEESPMNLIPDDFMMPAPIGEYLKLMANSTTPQGDLIRMNVPDAGLPRNEILREEDADVAAAADAVDQVICGPGSFGPAELDTHNAYECYVSPHVTASLVSETIRQNQERNFTAWSPLPEGMFPAGTLPTPNLLGYRARVERLDHEGLQAIQGAEMLETPDMAGRLRWSPELVARVSGSLKKLEDRYKMIVGRPPRGTNSAATGYIKTMIQNPTAVTRNTARISAINGPVFNSSALGSTQCNIVGLFGLKRLRSSSARGLCYVHERTNLSPDGWSGTVNANFTMTGPFAPTIGLDLPSLRMGLHESPVPAGDRALAITSWTRRNFLLKK